METSLRLFATAGAAMVSAGAIGITPVAPPPDDIRFAPRVQLTAASDVFSPDPSTLDGAHRNFYNLLPYLEDFNLVKLSPLGRLLVDFSTTSLSGVGLGLVGPVVGPAVVLGSNFNDAVSDLMAADPGGALTTFANTPGQMLQAFLFGGVNVDITGLVAQLGPLIGVEFPPGISLGIVFGGLLSPGGSAFNSLDFNLQNTGVIGLPGVPIDAQLADGNPAGPFGSLADLAQVIGNGVSEVPQFDIPAFGQLLGNVLEGFLRSNFGLRGVDFGTLFSTGLGAILSATGLGDAAGNGLGDVLGGLGGILGLGRGLTAANAVPDSVQSALAGNATATGSTALVTLNTKQKKQVVGPRGVTTTVIENAVDEKVVTENTVDEKVEADTGVDENLVADENAVGEAVNTAGAEPVSAEAAPNTTSIGVGKHRAKSRGSFSDQVNAAVSDFGKALTKAVQPPKRAQHAKATSADRDSATKGVEASPSA
jgi:hypothetical protein